MRIDTLLASKRPVFSFEFFPPDDADGEERLIKVIDRLRADCHPDFVSVTCRNHSRMRTLEVVTRIRDECGVTPMAHFTCAGATQATMHDVLAKLNAAGIENVLALRGDPPKDAATFVPSDDGLRHGSDLAALIRDTYDFCIGGACYPEVHVEATGMEAELEHTRTKVQSGCSFLITQMFFNNEAYFAFVERARAAGISVPIIPGILPITSLARLSRDDATLFGARIPADLSAALLRREGDDAALVQLGAAYATLQCSELLAAGAPGIHFYTLNRSPATRAILSALLAARPWERAR
jgi:methylenetetrahydrofolate reductase (NADPH)